MNRWPQLSLARRVPEDAANLSEKCTPSWTCFVASALLSGGYREHPQPAVGDRHHVGIRYDERILGGNQLAGEYLRARRTSADIESTRSTPGVSTRGLTG